MLWCGLLGLACGVRQDELECELAAAHVQSCCPDYSGSFDCRYVSGCGEFFPPAEEDMRLLQSLECEQVVAAGFCDADVFGSSIRPGQAPETEEGAL